MSPPLPVSISAGPHELDAHATIAATERIALAATDGRDCRAKFHAVTAASDAPSFSVFRDAQALQEMPDGAVLKVVKQKQPEPEGRAAEAEIGSNPS